MSESSVGRGRAPHRRSGPDPAAVAQTIRELTELLHEDGGSPRRPSASFVDSVGDNLLKTDPVELAAFRSPDLAPATLQACRQLAERTLEWIQRLQVGEGIEKRRADRAGIPRNPGESDRAYLVRVEKILRQRADNFRMLVRREMRFLDAIVTGMRAQSGVLPNAPNPRRRAMLRLAERHPQEFLALLREEQQIDREKAAAARARAKRQARRERGRS